MTDSNAILRAVLVILLVLISIPFVMLLAAVPFMEVPSGTGGMHGGAWLWLVLPLLILVAIGYGSYRLLGGGPDGDAAIEELRLAYARGDLTDEEYETRRQRLESDEIE